MGKDLNNRTQRRHFEVDVAKAFAIVFMVVVHVYTEMSGIDFYHAMPDSLLRNVIEYLGGPPTAPVFMVAMGMGMVMTRHDSPKEFMRRGVRLFIAGYALNFFRGTIPILIAQAVGIVVETTALDTFWLVTFCSLQACLFC